MMSTFGTLQELNALRLANGITRAEYDALKDELLASRGSVLAPTPAVPTATTSVMTIGSEVVLSPAGFGASNAPPMMLVCRREVKPGQRAKIVSLPAAGRGGGAAFVEVQLQGGDRGWIRAQLCRKAERAVARAAPPTAAVAATAKEIDPAWAPFWEPPTGAADQVYAPAKRHRPMRRCTGALYGAATGSTPSVSFDDGETWETYEPAAIVASLDFDDERAQVPRCAKGAGDRASCAAALEAHGIEYACASAATSVSAAVSSTAGDESSALPLAPLDINLNSRLAPLEQRRRRSDACARVIAMIRALVLQGRGPMCVVASSAAARDDVLAEVWARCYRGPSAVLHGSSGGGAIAAPPCGVPLVLHSAAPRGAGRPPALAAPPRLAELAALYARRGEEVLFASLLAPRARANELVAYIVGCALAVGSSPIDRPWLAGRSPNGRVYARPVFELVARLGARRAKGGSAASLTSLTIGGVAITVEKGRELLEVELARTQ
jgi:hypothetical protein